MARPFLVALVLIGTCACTPDGTDTSPPTTDPPIGVLAPASPPDDGPPSCEYLTSSPALTDLGQSLSALASGDSPELREALADAAGVLRATPTESSSLDEAANNAADDLDSIVAGGLTDERSEALATSLADLGSEVQLSCDFPLG